MMPGCTELQREQPHRALGGAVAGQDRGALQPGHRGHVDDAAAVAAQAHDRDRVLHAQEHPVHIDRGLALEVSQGHVQHRAGEADPGIVHQDVQAAVSRLDGGGHVDPGLFGGDVVMVVRGAAALGLDGLHDLGALGVLQVGDHDHGAFLGQPLRAAPADAARPAGDQRHLAFDPAGHRVFSLISDQFEKTPIPGAAACPASLVATAC
jgi:hypothetical protein